MVVGTKGSEYRTLIKRMPYTLRVGNAAGGDTEYTSIQAAINYAATQAPSATNPWTIYIYPGIYNERVTCSSWVNLKGIGPKGSVVIYQNDTDGVLVTANNIEVQNLTIRLGTISAPRGFITNVFVACIARFSDIVFECVTPGVFQTLLFRVNATCTFTIENCSCVIAGSGTHISIYTGAAASTFIINNCDFAFTASTTARHLYIDGVASSFSGAGNKWRGTAGFLTADAGTLTFDNDAIICTGAWTNTGSTIALRNCAIEAPVVAGNLATVRLKNCSYRAISRSGTGNIVDESPSLMDAPWKVHKWNWMAVLAQSQVAIRGTPQDAGSGQVLLEVTDNAAGQEAVERFGEIAGALGNEFTPARTPRFLTQISVDSFDAHITMFFGLRDTLGNAVPAHPEHHAGFIWTGAAFNASSNDGVATQTTALATPSTDAQHQLEVIIFGGVTTVGKVEFYVDGILVATHSTRIPVSALDWQHLLATAGAGGGDLVQVTVRNGGCQSCPT